MEYEPTNEEIIILQKQIYVNTIDAKKLLSKHIGNITESVLDFYEKMDNKSYTDTINKQIELDKCIDDNIINTTTEISNKDKINIMRQILNEKDEVFQKKVGKEIDISDKDNFTYIKFNYNTKLFKKETINSDRNSLINTIVKPYLDIDYISVNITDDKQLLCKYLGKNSKNMIKKWGLYQPAIFYYNNQIINTISDKTNIVATKILQKAEHINDDENIMGPVFIINKWF